MQALLDAVDDLDFFGAAVGTCLIEEDSAFGTLEPVVNPFRCPFGGIADLEICATFWGWAIIRDGPTP